MKVLRNILCLTLVLAACTNKTDRKAADLYSENVSTPAASGHTYKQAAITLKKINTCSYPKNDPLFEKKKNRKLIVLQVAVQKLQGAVKEDIIPLGAALTDERGNSYETTPGVIAMAQAGGCIAGDDLNSYNSIWNGEIKTGETKTAFVLGFEVPENAVPEKIYWNKNWAVANQYILLSKNDYTVNH